MYRKALIRNGRGERGSGTISTGRNRHAIPVCNKNLNQVRHDTAVASFFLPNKGSSHIQLENKRYKDLQYNVLASQPSLEWISDGNQKTPGDARPRR